VAEEDELEVVVLPPRYVDPSLLLVLSITGLGSRDLLRFVCSKATGLGSRDRPYFPRELVVVPVYLFTGLLLSVGAASFGSVFA